MHASLHATRRTLLLAGLGGVLSACAAPMRTRASSADLPALASAAPVRIPASRQFDVTLAGQRRRIFVALPPDPAPPGGHPVLYALDGNALFPLLAPLARQRAARPDDVRIAAPAVIGLGYATDDPYDMAARADDYTLAPLPGASADAGGTGADRFLDFLEHDVQPWLARQFPVASQRQTLFGHSYGGLLTLYALFTRPHLFQRYVAASPSIWWGDRAILPLRDRFVQQHTPLPIPASLLVTAGSLEEGVPNRDPERARRQQARKQISSARDLVRSLQHVPDLQAQFRLLDGEDHGSVVPPSAALAVRAASAPVPAGVPA
ncbi:alpha/beta hydrolase [Burkholderia alba]|uniref:alpha/beta hydrolase n=1 Tax=Burkholderia alba TaxID=2683677 RepID=UPI002B062012|nr:alpha/beta hydrolase-fold protein [Burkholderia alba]